MSTPSQFTRYSTEREREEIRPDRRQVSMDFYYFSIELCFSIIKIFHWHLARCQTWVCIGGVAIETNWVEEKLTLISKQEKSGGTAGCGWDYIHMTIQLLRVEFLQGKYVNCLVIKMSRAPGRICEYKFYETFPSRVKGRRIKTTRQWERHNNNNNRKEM